LEEQTFVLPDSLRCGLLRQRQLVDVDAKVAGCLRDGVRLVWVFNPRENAVIAHTPERIARTSSPNSLTVVTSCPVSRWRWQICSRERSARFTLSAFSASPGHDRLIVYHLAANWRGAAHRRPDRLQRPLRGHH